MTLLVPYLGGLVSMGFVVSALLFLRFWTKTRDGLFLSFALAFVLFALNQAVVSLGIFPHDQQSAAYLLRLAGYALISFAIIRKNIRSSSPKGARGTGTAPGLGP